MAVPAKPQLQSRLQAAITHHQQGRLREAKALYEEVLRAQPGHADALHLLGVMAAQTGQPGAAVELIGRALRAAPDNAVFHGNLGNALRDAGRALEALTSYETALRLAPGDAQTHSNRAVALNDLRRFDEALAACDQALAIAPGQVEALHHRGNALAGLGRHGQALADQDSVLALRPDHAQAHYARGNALTTLGRPEEALAAYDRAIALRPAHAGTFANRGAALARLNRIPEALADYQRAIAIEPGHAEAHWNQSLALLLSGDFARGWPLYEWRWKTEAHRARARSFDQPPWLGAEPLEGRTILLHAEQGLGDTIQFCRYAAQVAALGARVILEVQKPLTGLLRGLEGVSAVIARGDPLPDFDLHCPLLSLPLACGTKAPVPLARPYLRADEAKLRDWARRLGEKFRPRIGLAWSGSATHVNDANRSLAFASIKSLLSPDFEWISLHRELRPAEEQTVSRSGIAHFGDALQDFSDTAALCSLMDRVISVDTSVAHLAGALGRPVRLLLPFAPDWRWMRDRDDSPWYPTARLYRQERAGDWSAPLHRMAEDLAREFRS